jgi:hypothetical protein
MKFLELNINAYNFGKRCANDNWGFKQN